MGCCCSDDNVATERDSLRNAQHQSPPHRQPRPPPVSNKCAICGIEVDSALIDGHQESCRMRHKRQMKRQDAPPEQKPKVAGGGGPLPKPGTPMDVDVEEGGTACIICMESAVCIAFVPCGHLCVCASCAMRCESCPCCRGPRDQLLYIDPKVANNCTCKHCKHTIAPSIFDGHREVCALRMRQAKERSEEGGDQNASGYLRQDTEGAFADREKCVDCRQRERSTALLPCGHFLFCHDCAEKKQTCPVCIADVAGRMSLFSS